MNIWFDYTNPPHVNFFNPLLKKYKRDGHKVICTARDFAETIKLLKINNIDFKVYGKHRGKNKIKKIGSLVERVGGGFFNVKAYDFSFSSNYEAPFVSWVKRKPSFVFDDNDISPNWLYSKFATFVFSPKYIDKLAMYKMGITAKQLILYDGFKEEIYIAAYTPDPLFLKKLPFENFVTVRPENIQASYVPENVKSIVPELIKKITDKGINVLYLPRYKDDRDMIKMNDRIFIPDNPLNGLDVCYYSSAVLTGAGSFSREASVIGTPAVSFFAGNQFLGVDKEMFRKKHVFYSRNSDDIVKYILSSRKRKFDYAKCRSTQEDLFSKLTKAMRL